MTGGKVHPRQHVFLSYRSLERPFALKLAAELRNAGVIVWVDRLDDGIQAGDDWQRTVEEALNTCRALIAVVSPDYVASQVCRRELHRADHLSRTLFPVLLKPVSAEQWPLEIDRLQYVDFTNWSDEDSFRQSVEALVGRLHSGAKEVIGQRPDPEQQYLITLITELEARGGVGDYVVLAADLLHRDDAGAEKRKDLLGQVRSVFDPEFLLLEQSVRATSTRLDGNAEPKGLPDILEIINNPRRCVLLGEPGGGKTTTLRRLTLEAARARLIRGPHAPMPLLLQLPLWRSEPDPLAFVESHWPFEADVGAALTAGEVILFLDGLNEMGAQGVIKAQLIRNWIDSPLAPQRLVLTCRTQDYTPLLDLEIDEVTVKPMDEERIQRFAVTYLQEDAPSFLKRIDLGKSKWAIDHERSLFRLARNPYLLTCLILLHQKSPTGELPSNMGSLFRLLAEFLWNRELIRQTRGWIPFVEAEACFGALGFKMIEDDRPTTVPRHYANGICGGEDMIHCGVSASILDPAGNQIRFYHQLMQEYFAAVHMYRTGSGHLPNQFEPKWSQVIIALCGIADNPESTVLEATTVDAYLGGRCVESGIVVSDETRQRIVGELNQELELSVEPIKRREREKNPRMSWSSIHRMEDAVDDYFGSYIHDLSTLLHKIRSARASR